MLWNTNNLNCKSKKYFDIIYKYNFVAHVIGSNQKSYMCFSRIFLKLGFTPCKAEQPLWGMELQEKEAEKD